MSKLPEWVPEMVEKGQSIETCLTLWRDLSAVELQERTNRRAEEQEAFERIMRTKDIQVKERKSIFELSWRWKKVNRLELKRNKLYLNLLTLN
ncbi:hypothetical protein KP79_PYT03447 [Mizuhopecten yessoensis]|uniref:Uncharacterized protein n=1 Tax=Mizuhopecten yessoensis TaxID=6573 RepID=A0A210PDE0_MIZYE|nr:hypothetical protein KP79_PYT03447 [Mizuhopecten yessoensis]